MKKYLFVLSVVLVQNLTAQTVTIGTTTVPVDTIYTGLYFPWEVIYGPDGHLWVTERRGLVSRIDPVAKTKNVVLNITSSVFLYGEAGLLGMAIDPDFGTNKQVYLVYTYGNINSSKERLVRYVYTNGNLVDPTVLIDNIPGNYLHIGSRLLFLPDKTLLMTTGDALVPASAQNLNSLAGKVLRLNTDGTVPSDNPFADSYVYTFGHRNPQGLMLAPDGKVYLSEHGPANDDELQVLEAGRNYGWPTVEGFCDTPAEQSFCASNNVKEPVFDWTPTIAPNDMVWYNNPGLPEFDGGIVMAVLKGKQLTAMRLNAAGTVSVSENSYLINQFGRIRDVCVGPNKEIYFATNGNLTPADVNTHSFLVLRPVNITTVSAVTVEENEWEQHVTVYPNPVREELTMTLPYKVQADVFVTDVLGKVLIQHPQAHGVMKLPVSELNEGVYFIRVEQLGRTVYRSRFVKN